MANKKLNFIDDMAKKKIFFGLLTFALVGGLFLSACGNSSTNSARITHNHTHQTTATTKQKSTPSSSGTTSKSSPSTTIGGSNCNEADLTLAEDQSLSVVSAGSTELAIVITNKGSSTCDLNGYPNLEFFAPKGGLNKVSTKPIQLKITNDGTSYKPVSLSSEGRAVFYIKYFSVPVDGVGCSIIGSISVGLNGVSGKANLNVGFPGCGPGVVVYPLVLLS